MSSKEVQKIEQEIRRLELVIDGIFPISALGSMTSLVVGPIGIIGSATAGAVGISLVRKYAKEQKPQLIEKMKKLRKKGELDEIKFKELSAILNEMTVEG